MSICINLAANQQAKLKAKLKWEIYWFKKLKKNASTQFWGRNGSESQ